VAIGFFDQCCRQSSNPGTSPGAGGFEKCDTSASSIRPVGFCHHTESIATFALDQSSQSNVTAFASFVQQVVHGIYSLCLIEVFLRYHLLTGTTYGCIRGTIMSNSRYFYGPRHLNGISAAWIWPLIVLIAAGRNNQGH
jgi:hypothetical protein